MPPSPSCSPTSPPEFAPAAKVRAGHPSWTPDGKRIIFTRITNSEKTGDGSPFDGYGQRRIAFVDPDGSDLQVIDGLWSTHPREQP